MLVAVAILCAVLSLVCVGLLARAWRGSGVPLLLWCLVCFAGLALNNILLVVDEVSDTADLDGWRQLPAALGVAALCYGLVLRSDRR